MAANNAAMAPATLANDAGAALGMAHSEQEDGQ
jgi:hypothetical protein